MCDLQSALMHHFSADRLLPVKYTLSSRKRQDNEIDWLARIYHAKLPRENTLHCIPTSHIPELFRWQAHSRASQIMEHHNEHF